MDIANFDSLVWFGRLALLFALVWIVYVDTVRLKIPNKATVTIFFFGLIFALFAPSGAGLLHPVLPGSYGIKTALLSFAIVLVLGFAFFALKLWGAGDAKLLAALSIWLSWRDLPLLVFLVAICGGGLAISRMIAKRNAKEVFSSIQVITMSRLGGIPLHPLTTVDRMPFSWAIGAAWIVLMVLKLFEFV